MPTAGRQEPRPQTQLLTDIPTRVFLPSDILPLLTQAGCAVSILRPGVTPCQMEQQGYSGISAF